MILNDPKAEFEGHLPAGNRLTFQLKSNPKMFQILSDGIYADKIMAVIRELSCNARDSNVMAGSKTPFTVNVPTDIDVNFWVEDTGLGIDPEKIVDIFWTYGASTKTDSNDTIGALGLGSKSPFAYTKSSFLVINRYNGMEYKYFCFINENGVPDGKEIMKGVTDKPNGVRVELAVRTDDIMEFRRRIVRFFSFWDADAMPSFHGYDLTDEINAIKARRHETLTWRTHPNDDKAGRGAFAVMGGVPYPIKRGAITNCSPELDAICGTNISITFPMGSLSFQVSREELSYDDGTVATLNAMAKHVVEHHVSKLFDQVNGLCETPFELMKLYGGVYKHAYEAFPIAARGLAAKRISLKDGRTFDHRFLTSTMFNFVSSEHLPFDIQRVDRDVKDYVKGRQLYGVKSVARIELELLTKPGASTIRRVSTQIVDWYDPSLQPAPQLNANRKRTTANYLHEGYAFHRLEFSGSYNIGAGIVFVVNDLGERGNEGIRFYKGKFPDYALAAFSSSTLFFIDGAKSNVDADKVEASITKLFTNSSIEGCPIIRLSKLPDFKLPEAPKVDPKPRAPIQRGTIEQRAMIFKASQSNNIEIVGDLEVTIPAISRIDTDYIRHTVAERMLYVEASYGVPLVKNHTDNSMLSALFALGHFDKFMQADGTFRLYVLSSNQIEECVRRKIPMTNIKDLISANGAEELLKTDHELITAMNGRARPGADSQASIIIARISQSARAVKVMLPELAPSNVIVSVMTARDKIRLLLQNKVRAAALYLIYNTPGAQTAFLDGKISLAGIMSAYPLLPWIVNNLSSVSKDVEYLHLAHYINAIDQLNEEKRQLKKRQELANLYAEALFESE